MTNKLEAFNKSQIKAGAIDIRPGDTVRVHEKPKAGEKRKGESFEGLVLAKKHGEGNSAMITVRRVSLGVGVQRIFPIHSPNIEKIEIVKRSKARRAKLNYLKTAKGRKARLKREEYKAVIAPQEAPAPVAEVKAEETAK
jgi:large subunit ribosomal protein L19